MVKGREPPMERLDRLDFKIMAYLQRFGRVSNVELADAVGLSASPCLTRVKRLERCGYITSYGAHLELGKLGDHLIIFTEITLLDHRMADFQRFLNQARAMAEILECHHVSGGYDFLLKIVAKSVSHYQRLIESLLESDAGIDKYFSYIVLDSPILRNGYPIGRLFGESPDLDV